ncbi:SRPBCC family protein [Agrococcus sp. ProA11]|uniref:SRPBCC family protein n=1 Tax=Agrococcus chionoecetis TaxID=3153752 RepID=UPI003261815C
MDVLRQLGAVSRGVRTEEIDGQASTVQTLEQVYPSSLADVWDAVTRAERIARWFMPVSGDLRLGGSYQLEGNAGGRVLECTPPADDAASYRVTWEFGGGVTWLTIRLAAEGQGTRLELEHVARDADLPVEMAEMFGPGATGVGWDGGLLGLSRHLSGSGETGMDAETLNAWAASEEGRSFYRGAADAWARAAIGNGVAATKAQAQADATFGFYTGETGAGASD